MSTVKELESLLRKAKKELREVKTHNGFLLERLELSHERLHEERKKRLEMTLDDVVKMHKERALYEEKIKKDREVIETLDKQKEVVLNGKL